MPRVELRLLGPVEISAGGEPSDLDGGRPRLVLLALFTAEGHQLSTDQLSERCFRDDDRPLDPRPALRTAVHRVRRALGEHAVVTRRGGYQLDLTEITVDVERFETLIAAARGHDVPAEEAIEHLEVALSLWRGRPFGDLDAEWLEPERVRLEELQLIALETWFEAGISSGSATEILPMLESTALVHPLRERFHRQLMLALYLGGRQAEALQVFQRHRDALIEVGLDPGAEVVDLEHRISRGDPSLRTVGAGATSVRGYHLIEQVGDGAFSVVYRATQPSVDREVAVKQIRADLANRPEFIRRFESEAQIVARLEHPHIVPLYDFWREPGSAYLVMRYLRGGSVEDRLRSSPIPLEVVARMVDQVGLALMAAHRVGVIHRDVKPGNILLDDEDNAFLADFGIAIDLNDAVAGSSGATEVFKAATPSYAPPEQLRGEEAGPSSDVFAFGLTVHRALSGSVPSADEPSRAGIDRHAAERLPSVCRLRPEIPTSVDGVLRKATAVEPADRFQSVAAFIAAFRAALGSVATPTAMVTAGAEAATIGVAPVEPLDRNPFKGLRAFGEGDAVDFAGRSRLVDQLLAVLAEHRLVAVVGPSGSGKSSVVRAGLLPAIRHGRVEGSADWFIATMVPSANPVHELAAALSSVASRQAADRSDLLAPDGLGLVRAIRDALPAGGQLLLVIDQFEELFTNAEDESTTRRFLDMLASAVSDAASPLRAVITLRADFFDRPLSHARLGQAMQRAVVPVPPLAPDELERVIVDPAEANGGILEPGLVSQIVADVAGEPGMLPMLQYTLTELWEHRVSGMLTKAAYREMGGVTGALAARAEELHG